MDEVEPVVETTTPSHAIQFGRVIVAASATYIATKLAETVYDNIVARRRNKTNES